MEKRELQIFRKYLERRGLKLTAERQALFDEVFGRHEHLEADELLMRLRAKHKSDAYRAVEAEVLLQLGNGLIDATYFCPDIPGQPSEYRKPAPGMVLQAARDHHVDLTRSFFVGDKEIDVECGHNAGLRSIRVRTGSDKMTDGSAADWIAEDFPGAAEIILHAT